MVSTTRTIVRRFTRLERLVFTGTVLSTLFSGAFLSASAFANATHAMPDDGGVYHEGVIGQPIYLNPLITNGNDPDRDIIKLVFGNIYDIAEKIEASDDGRTWTIRVPEDTFWHDGTRLTSDDIIFTIEKIQEPETDAPLISSWRGVIMERKSELELTLTINTKYAFFEENLKNVYILPKHIWAPIPAANWRLSSYNLEPIGSGPYKFDGYKKRRDGFITEYSISRNEEYADTKPYIQTIQFKFYQNAVDIVEAFNLAYIDGFGGTNLPTKEIRRRHDIYTLATPRYYAIFLNQLTNSSLKDDGVRRILDAAIDKAHIVATVLNSNGIIVDGPLPPSIPGYDSSAIAKNEDISLDEMRAYIESAEEPLVFDLIVPQTDFLIKTAELIKTAWEKIGVQTNLIILNANDINTEIIRTRNYHMLLFGNVLSGSPDLFSFWHSSQRFHPGLNLSLYESKKADAYIEKARRTSDPEARKEKLSELQSVITKDMPAIFLYSPHYTYISGKLQGFQERFAVTPSDRFNTISEWYIRTKRVLR